MGERKNIPRKKNSRGWFLSFEERKRIEELLDTGTSTKQISLILGKSQGTIFREITRNGGYQNYTAELAESQKYIRDDSRKKTFENGPRRAQNPLKKMNFFDKEGAPKFECEKKRSGIRNRINPEERIFIEKALKSGCSYYYIDTQLERDGGVIKNEIIKNGGPLQYDAQRANQSVIQRAKRKDFSLSPEEKNLVKSKISEKKSIVQIAKDLQRRKKIIWEEISSHGGYENYKTEEDSLCQETLPEQIEPVPAEPTEKIESALEGPIEMVEKTSCKIISYEEINNKIINLEMQIEILTETILEMKRNGFKN